MSAELEGKVAIITGAGKGLGQAIAERFGQAGATVVVSDINEAAARKVAENIPGATAHTCDVRDEEQVKGLVDAAIKEKMASGEFGRLYAKWFESPTPPKGQNLQLPMSEAMKARVASPSDALVP